jgi:hypothetical protein
MFPFFRIILTAALLLLVPAAAHVPTTIIHEFSNPTRLEGVAVRCNGQILVTSISNPTIRQVDPLASLSPIDVATIPDATSLLGITELSPDIFYVIAGDLSNVTADRLVFPSKIWRVDLRSFLTDDEGIVSQPSAISLVADLSNTTFLNTMSPISPRDTSHLLISDSGAGQLLRLDVTTGITTVVLSDTTTKSPRPGVAGITGIHTYNGDLFYANLAREQLYKVSISPLGTPTSEPVLITNGTLIDDFCLSRNGKKAYAATNPRNLLIEIDIESKTFRNLTPSLNATSAALGRMEADYDSVYVVNGGGLGFPLTNPGVTGGRVVRVDVEDS